MGMFICVRKIGKRKVSMGNIMQETILEIWTGKILTAYRKNLISGKRCSGRVSLVTQMVHY